MLSRTADHLYWMARYTERAENIARMLDVTYRVSLLPNAAGRSDLGWRAVLSITGLEEAFAMRFGAVTPEKLLRFMMLDPANPSSIYSCVRAARENGHAVRGTLTAEMWETLNATWIEMRAIPRSRVVGSGATEFFDWVKERSHLFRGVVFGTMLHDDAFRFIRLGTFIERADNTARILDVKYHVLLPETEQVGGYVDYYQWGALLRSVGAFRAYRRVYHDTVYPWRIAELLILREDMPRSLHHCYQNLIGTLDELAGKKSLECRRLAGHTYAGLKYGRIDRIFRSGLHEFLIGFIEANNALGMQIQEDFLMIPLAAPAPVAGAA
jgi:uncharacterized alpha-E superfamily protein